MIEQRFYDERELSAYSGIAVRTLQSWRLRSLGPPWVKFGNGRAAAVRYDVRSVDRWIQECPTSERRVA